MFHNKRRQIRLGTGSRNPSVRQQENFAMTHTASTPFFALFGQMVARVWRVSKNRRQFAELNDWSDEQLKDIGLTRSDVRRALAQPFYTDPTSLVNGSSALRETIGYSAANSAQDKPVMTLVTESKTRQLAA
ncbi:DUF1127 domain-containing protein [Roseibium aggregatum]|jgi:uncharacterized protein YjiS (DUF1127 family)|nr:DUF1127 domain-containing protein [Roseibium aggregatum]UES46268.1 DUF1127 domain-containing protein [Roseibium aggregatum]